MNTEKISWQELCRLEPRLQSLFNEAVKTRKENPKRFDYNTVWYRDFRDRMAGIVGFSVNSTGIISTSEAYNVAYDKLYNALRNGI